MKVQYAIAIVVVFAVCQVVQCQEQNEFEQFVESSPVGPGWMEPSRFPSFLAWLDSETARTTDATRRSNLLATTAYIRHCNSEKDAAKKLIGEAILQCPAGNDRNLIIAARILDSVESVQQLETIPKQSKWHTDAILQKASHCIGQGKVSEALTILEAVPDENVYLHYVRATCLFKTNAHKARVELMRYMETSDCGPTEGLSGPTVMYAAVLWLLKEYGDALKTCENGLKAYPKERTLRYIMSRVLCELDRAHEALEIAMSLEEECPGTAQSSISMGAALFKLAEYNKAILYLRRGHDLIPKDFTLSYDLASALMYCGRNEEAISVAKKFLASTEISEQTSGRASVEFLIAVNESFRDGLSAERKESLRCLLRDGGQNVYASGYCRIFACCGLHRLGEPKLARELFVKLFPKKDFDELIADVEKEGTVVANMNVEK